MGEMNAYNTFVGKREVGRALGRRKYSWESNIKKDVRGMGWEILDWIHLAQDRDQWQSVMNTRMNIRFP
jgi:hypothetical protein